MKISGCGRSEAVVPFRAASPRHRWLRRLQREAKPVFLDHVDTRDPTGPVPESDLSLDAALYAATPGRSRR